MFVSVVIPTHNKAKRLELTLLSLSLTKQRYPSNKFEVIVVDDGSSDNTKNVVAEFINKQVIDIKYFYQENKGRAAARNNGIKQAKGEVIIFLDDDRLVENSFIDQHIKFFKGRTNKNIAVLGKRMNLYISRIDEDFGEIKKNVEKDIRQIFKKGREEYYWRKTKKVFQMPAISWIAFTTGNVSISKKVLFDAGLFNESFQGWGLEDTELGFRLWKNNTLFISNEKAVNYHIEHPRDLDKRKEEETRNHELFYCLHPELPVKLFRKYVYGEISLENFNIAISGEGNLCGEGETFYKKGNILG